jgi:hypothetical protein
MRRLTVLAMLLGLALPAVAATTLLVTVVDRKTGLPLTDLKAGDFSVKVDGKSLPIASCEYIPESIDIVLMLDSSLLGEQISSLAPSLIQQLTATEQMAMVAFDSSAELIRPFTSSKELLLESFREIRYGNSPQLLDGVYAVAADGFSESVYRRVILVLSTGVDAPGGVTDDEVIKLCRERRVSIYSVYGMGYGRSKLEKLARFTGGASFNVLEIGKVVRDPSERIFNTMRGRYELTLTKNLPLGDGAIVDVDKGKQKRLLVSFLELE